MRIVKIFLRQAFKSPVFSGLNLLGLSLGIAGSFVLFLHVYREKTYESAFPDAARTYRIATDFFNMGGFASSQQQLPAQLMAGSRIVEAATQVDRAYSETPLLVRGQTFDEQGGYFIDSAFFTLFPFPLVEGTLQNAVLRPGEMALHRDLAKKLFGEGGALGQVVLVGKEKKPYRVAAVFREPDAASHLKPRFLLPLENDGKLQTNWLSARLFNYVKLRPAATQKNLEQALDQVLRRDVYPTYGANAGTFEQWQAGNSAVKFFVQPLRDIYLTSNFQFELSPGGNPVQVTVLGIIGLFILLIAGINYVNLTTARASARGKEVGVKKSLGAGRGLLARQFLVESLCFSVLALLLAGVWVEGLLYFAGRISGEPAALSLLENGRLALLLAGFSLAAGLLAGLYPAFFLTRFQPARIFKGQFSVRDNRLLRNGLVTTQFAIAVALMAGCLVVFRQLHFMQNKDLGFLQKGVLIVDNVAALGQNREAFRQELERQNQVLRTSFNDRLPAGNSLWMYTYRTSQMKEDLTLQTFPADENFIPTLEFRLRAGRNFKKDFDTDSTAAIINESAAKALGLSDPLGAEINQGLKVIGVVSDFHFQSLREKIEPVVIRYNPDCSYTLAVQLTGNNMPDLLDGLQKTWKRFAPEEPLRYHFLDENFEKLARKEAALFQAAGLFTGLALFIACLGLLGLAIFTAERRTKEIGIRKVLGASTAGITTLLARDFLKLVLLAVCIATPAAYYFMQKWLQGFAYRIELEGWMFFAAGAAALAIAFFTVSFQSIKAALANPVQSLRNE